MHVTNRRYAWERNSIDLAIRMIGHEARTRTIRSCTGLSDDRIRKLYATYFLCDPETRVKRRRGKTPRRPGFFVASCTAQLESTTLASLFITSGLLRVEDTLRLKPGAATSEIAFGNLFCDTYESYQAVHHPNLISFEHAWNLLDALARHNELGLGECRYCTNTYVLDLFEIDDRRCPCCRVADGRRRRSGPKYA